MDFFRFLKDDLGVCLNEQQIEAVKLFGKRVLLEACPGSGKTTTLVSKNAYLILCGKTEPSDILTLTFSRA
ncbi:MAG TPA: UvrD-helicase domain-containing protein, partial [Clostridia bacterium]